MPIPIRPPNGVVHDEDVFSLNDLHYGDWEWRTYEEVRAR